MTWLVRPLALVTATVASLTFTLSCVSVQAQVLNTDQPVAQAPVPPILPMPTPSLPLPNAIAPTAIPAGPASPAALPGNGLAEHSFLYAGEYNYPQKVQTMFIVRGGHVVWTYTIPTKDATGTLEEFSDATMLSNGNIVFAHKTGASEMTPDKKIIWNYDDPPGTETHSIQPLGLDRVLIMRNGNPAELMIINTVTNKIEKEIVVPTGSPTTHGQFRHVRMTKAGTFLVPHMDMGRVDEIDDTGKVIWSVPAPSVWAAVRLRNGNTLLSGNGQKYVREVNPKGETVWELTQADIPEYTLYNVQEADRLANGDTVFCNWCAGGPKPPDWPGTVQVIEVNPAKHVVWALRAWTDPDNLGPSASIQLLDQKGKAEKFDLAH